MLYALLTSMILNFSISPDISHENENQYTKNKIDNYPKDWEIAKKMIHDFEYIYTSSNLKKNICILYMELDWKTKQFTCENFSFNFYYYRFSIYKFNC